MADIPENKTDKDTGVHEFVIGTLRKKKKMVITGFVVRIVLLVVIFIYMSLFYGWFSDFDADTAVALAKHKLQEELPGITEQLTEKLKETAPDVIDMLEQKSLEAIPELGAELEKLIVKRMREEVRPRVEMELTDILRKNIVTQFQDLKEAEPDMYTDENIDRITESVAAAFKDNALNAVEVTLARVRYWEKMQEINNWLKRLQKGENLTEREEYQRELIAATLKMHEIKTGGGFIRKKK